LESFLGKVVVSVNSFFAIDCVGLYVCCLQRSFPVCYLLVEQLNEAKHFSAFAAKDSPLQVLCLFQMRLCWVLYCLVVISVSSSSGYRFDKCSNIKTEHSFLSFSVHRRCCCCCWSVAEKGKAKIRFNAKRLLRRRFTGPFTIAFKFISFDL